LLGLLAQPTCEVGQADDVVAVVLGAFGQQDVGGAQRRCFAQKAPGVIGHRLIQWSAQRLPIGQEFGQCLGVHDGARQNVRTRLAAFFQDNH